MLFALSFCLLHGQAIFRGSGTTSILGTKHVSDLTWIQAINGFGPVERDRSNGENVPGDGAPLSIRGNTYSFGIGGHGYSDIRVHLGGTCTTFTSVVGIDDEEAGSAGAVNFQLWNGAVNIYDSGTLTVSSAPLPVSVSLAGIQDIGLIIVAVGPDSNHGDWGLATFTCIGQTPGPPALSITTSSLANGTVGVAYSQSVAATGGTSPYTWAITAGTLVAGMSMNTAGLITGTPTTTGSPSITFRATDAVAATASKAISLTVNAANGGPPGGSINVITDYGAVGNGVHNDAPNINNAIAACPANSQKTVYFPAGTYLVSSSINMSVTGCTLWGVRSSSIIKASGTADPILHHNTTNTDTTIFNMSFDGNNFADALRFDFTLTGGKISYCKIYNSFTAIWLGASAKSAARNTSIDHNIITGMISETAGTKGIHIQGSISDTNMDDNYLDYLYQGMEKPDGTAAGGTMTINRNTFIRGQRAGIEMMSTQNNATISGNWFGQWRQCVAGTTECGGNPHDASGNWFIYAQLISWATGGTGHTISNNFLKCTDGMTNGIEWSPSDPSFVTNNLIKVCTVPMYVTTASGAGITSNTVCTPYNTAYNTSFWNSAGASNHYYTNCSNVAVPADVPVPAQPF